MAERDGPPAGVLVDLAQPESVASLLGPLLLDRALHGGASTPFDNASQEAPGAPHGVYPCAGDDRWIAISVFDDDGWRRFVRAAGDPAWASDPRFASCDGRREQRRSQSLRTRRVDETSVGRPERHGAPHSRTASAAASWTAS